jgi:predicted signal transduction protein with EAL and GGDEF domain
MIGYLTRRATSASSRLFEKSPTYCDIEASSTGLVGTNSVAMLPNLCVDEAGVTAERIRKSIDALKPFGGVVKVTAGLGVAVSDRKELPTADALVRAADQAIYVSKFTTKNRVCIWPPDQKDAAQAEANRKKTARTAGGA